MARMPSSSPCPHSPRTNRRHRGVTLLELVVTMSVLAILTAVPERDMPPGLAAQIEMARVIASAAA